MLANRALVLRRRRHPPPPARPSTSAAHGTPPIPTFGAPEPALTETRREPCRTRPVTTQNEDRDHEDRRPTAVSAPAQES